MTPNLNKTLTTAFTCLLIFSSIYTGKAQQTLTCSIFKQPAAATSQLTTTDISFTASLTNDRIILNWVTQKEGNSNHFEVERSADGQNFKTIGLVLGPLEESAGSKFYKIKDQMTVLLEKNSLYYRLKQVNTDGTYGYSQVISLRMPVAAKSESKMDVSPNPFRDQVIVNTRLNRSGLMELRVLDLGGHAVKSDLVNIAKGANRISVENLGSFNAGIYFVQLVQDGVILGSQKIIKN